MWNVIIAVTNLSERRVRVAGTRTEGEVVRTYTLETIVPEGVTTEQAATSLANRVWGLYQADLAKEGSHASVIAGIATSAATKLDAKEPI